MWKVLHLINRLLTQLLLLPIYFYRNCISPLTPPTCRFTPTCSQYAIEAIRKLPGILEVVRDDEYADTSEQTSKPSRP